MCCILQKNTSKTTQYSNWRVAFCSLIGYYVCKLAIIFESFIHFNSMISKPLNSLPLLRPIFGSLRAACSAWDALSAGRSLAVWMLASWVSVMGVSNTAQAQTATRFTDVDGSSVANGQFKGVVITDAGDATEQTNMGKYQWFNTTTSQWVDLAAGLTDATSVFLAPTTLIRFQAAAGVASINQHELKARLVDLSGQTSTTGLTNCRLTMPSWRRLRTAYDRSSWLH
jgi:hypothetical protein